jgi:hypothetical protein
MLTFDDWLALVHCVHVLQRHSCEKKGGRRCTEVVAAVPQKTEQMPLEY